MGLPLARRVETARRQESNFVAPLLDAIRARGIQPETVACDMGYDNNRVYAECEERGCKPIIPLRGTRGKQVVLPLALGGRLFPRIPRHTQRFRDLYRGRAAVEREFGRLKHDYGLVQLRVRGLEKVGLHPGPTMLARLGQALARARGAAAVAA
jgi:Transposase DDE domain